PELLEIAAHRGLCGHHAVSPQELDELGLARHRLLLEQARDPMLALGLAERHSAASVPTSVANRERMECMRFSAWRHTTDCGPSMTSELTSSSRCAGRQCMKRACGP